MKKILTYLFAMALVLTACDKEYVINNVPQLKQCLTPVEVKAKVQYMKVSLEWRLFADAESYYVEVYSEVPGEGEEPNPEALFDQFEVAKDNVPYTFMGPEDMRCYFRVKAMRSGRADSRWASGTFKTDTDPTIYCSKPTNLSATAICDMVVFNWDTYPNTKLYELEVYDKFIPSSGEPDAANLVKKVEIEPTQLPDTLMFSPDLKLFYRVRAVNPDSELKPSKWLTGTSFETKAFVWPEDEKALNEKTTQDYKGTDDNGNPSPFTGSNTKNTEEITLNKFTYGVQCVFWGNRISLPAGNSSAVTSEFGAPVPVKNFMSFKTCKPGAIETYLTSTSGGEACVVVLTDKEGEGKKAKIIYRSSDIHKDYFGSGKTRDKIVIKEGDLYGIKEAATVYVFASNYKNVQVLQMIWTPTNL